jgi:ABC-type multidrug transport system fused ATPase/permease subunit
VVEVTGLRVEYDGRPALRDVDLRLEPGRRIAVVGASGSGKSTLLAALVGFVPTAAGSVRIGGVPIADCDLPATVGGVLADAHVFHASIADNVRLAAPDASDEAVHRALHQARLADWVDGLPAGAATVVGEDAALLSGGQRQRLLLARALLADPPILLLDEPSEGLDAATAEAVLADLLAATAERTDRITVLVTHRLTGLDAVDEVVLVDGGAVLERGPHQQLLERPGPYRDLWLAQTRNLDRPPAVNPPDQAVMAKS